MESAFSLLIAIKVCHHSLLSKLMILTVQKTSVTNKFCKIKANLIGKRPLQLPWEHSLISCEEREKVKEIRTQDFCDAGAVFYQLGYSRASRKRPPKMPRFRLRDRGGLLRELNQRGSLPRTGFTHLVIRREFIAYIFQVRIRAVLSCH